MEVNNNNSSLPILQGWLHKEKKSSSIFSKKTTRRWFTIESNGHSSFLSYYSSPKSSAAEKCGWIALEDVMDLEEVCETSGGENQQRSIGDDFQQFVIVISHPSRTYKLRANDRYQHRLWFDMLKTHCKNVDSNECKSDEDVSR